MTGMIGFLRYHARSILALLLLVLVIVVVWPVTTDPGIRRRKTVCLSHIRQIFTGLQLYGADYDDALPRQRGGNGNALFDVAPYLRNASTLQCPLEPRAKEMDYLTIHSDHLPAEFPVSYAINPWVLATARKWSEIIDLDRTVLLFETRPNHEHFLHKLELNERSQISVCSASGIANRIAWLTRNELLNPWIPSAIERNP